MRAGHRHHHLGAVLGDAARLVVAADHEARDVLQEQKRNAALAAQLNEVRGLERAFGEENAIVGKDADGNARKVREAGDQRRAVERLELVELGAVDQARDDLAGIDLLAQVRRHDAVELGRVVFRLVCRQQRDVDGFPGIEVGDDSSCKSKRMGVVGRHVVGDAGLPRVHVGTAQILGRDHLAGRGLHQRRAAEEDRALALHDDGLVAHRRHIGATGGARAHHHSDLRNPKRRQRRLIVEDAPEVLAVGKHLSLVRQVGTAGVDKIDARKPVLARDLLGAQVLLHRHRIVGAALDRRVVADDHAFAALDAADARDEARAVNGILVHAVRGQR
jgi:hypothetical protein